MATVDQRAVAIGVKISDPLLREFSCSYEGPGEIPDGAKLDYVWGLELYRFGPLDLGVEFSVEVSVGGFSGKAVYRMAFQLEKGSEAAAEPEKSLKALATRIAPLTMFPYVRETIGSAALRAGVHLTLPIQNVGALFSPEEVELPEIAPDESGGQSVPGSE